MTTDTKPKWQQEFPGFPMGEMPEELGSWGWEDTSWHNDVSPSFYSEELGLRLWIDRKDSEARERPRYSSRFVLMRQPDPEEPGDEIIATEEWAEIRTALKIRWTEYEREIGRA
jgi:hypothetical protein